MNSATMLRGFGMALLVSCTAAALTPSVTVAADPEGNYAVRGAGTQSCENYVSTIESQGEGVTAFLSWFEGYLSAYNRMSEETFDISPLVSPGEVAAVVLNICRNTDENIRVETALARLTNIFDPARIEQPSQVMNITVGDKNAFIRESTLRRVQEELRKKGHYNSQPDGAFGQETRNAIQAYQKATDGLPVTGVPDADTVLRLLINRES